MDSTASRIIKARQYAEERDKRIVVRSFDLTIEGEHDTHNVRYNDGVWTCDCEEFTLRSVCAHVMAMEEILGEAVEPAMMAVPSTPDTVLA